MILFHVLNRGVDKRKIFLDKQDHFRFIHDLFEFNDEQAVNTTHRSFYQSNDLGGRTLRSGRKKLVAIHFFCLMPNHYHLALSPLIDGGIPKFMQKVNAGYVKYFNIKYKRKGTLFEGKYKSIPIEEERHFDHLPYYIHFNPLDLKMPEWRERKIVSFEKAFQFLLKYRWSSHLDYLGIKNFPSVIEKSYFLEMFGGEEGYKKSITHWLRQIDVNDLGKYTLE